MMRSGFVFRDRMPDIILLRVVASTISATRNPLSLLSFTRGRDKGQHVFCDMFDHGDDNGIAELLIGLRARNGNLERLKNLHAAARKRIQLPEALPSRWNSDMLPDSAPENKSGALCPDCNGNHCILN